MVFYQLSYALRKTVKTVSFGDYFEKKLCDLIAVENSKSNEIGGSIECAQKYAAATN